ncbi:MAG TPA: NAD(P)H-binding protein [Dehalococcoidia bacterium]|nr:NAD(P)H-binding protein [Dehalococcoidia bacterium]
MARVLVTGASGFIGRRLIPELVKRGHEVRALVRKTRPDVEAEFQAVRGDVLERETLAPALREIEVVYLPCAFDGGFGGLRRGGP